MGVVYWKGLWGFFNDTSQEIRLECGKKMIERIRAF